MKKKLPIIIAVSLVVILAFSLIIAEVTKQSDPAPADDAYGEYTANDKLNNKRSAQNLDGENVLISYDRTENMSETPRSDRFDDYGTYDVFTDSDMNEYFFLADTALLCGIFGADNAPADPEAQPITEAKAIEYAEDFLDEIRTASIYTFDSVEYNDMGYYEVTYVYRVFNYKTDDVMRIWVTADGRVSSYSEFMYGRYQSLPMITTLETEINIAKSSLEANIASAMSGITYTMAGSYLTYSDDGDLEIVYVVDSERAMGDGYYTTERELFRQTV